MAIERRTRRIVRSILLVAIPTVWIYFRPHYRTVVECLLAVGALCAAVALVVTVFPYEKTRPFTTARPEKTIDTTHLDKNL